MSPEPDEQTDPRQTSFKPLLDINAKPVTELSDEALVESEYFNRSADELERSRDQYLTAAANPEIDPRERQRARSFVQRLTRAVEEARERQARAQQRGDPPGCWCLGLGGHGQRGLALGSPLDMNDLHPTSRVDSFIPPGHDLAPIIPKVYCSCGIGQQQRKTTAMLIDAWRRGWSARQAADQLKQRWDESGLPPPQRVRSLDQYPQNTPEQRATIAAVKTWKITRWLYLEGPIQRGKTSILEALARRALEEGHTVKFAEIGTLMDHLVGGYARKLSQEDLLRPYKECDFLFLDDIGARKASPFVLQQLFQILEYRKQRVLPIAFSSNRSLIALRPSRSDAGELEGTISLSGALLGRIVGPSQIDVNDPDDPEFAELAEYVARIEIRMRLMCTIVSVLGPPLRAADATDDRTALDW